MDLDKDLAQSEIDELELFLDSDATPEATMSVSSRHGFLTALAAAPVIVPIDEMLAAVWGEEGPLFDTEEEAVRISGMILLLFNSVSRTLAESPGDLVPLLYEEGGDEGELRLSAEDWCSGFTIGVGLRAQHWERFVEDESAAILLAPIISFTSAEAMAELFEKASGKFELNREILISFGSSPKSVKRLTKLKMQ